MHHCTAVFANGCMSSGRSMSGLVRSAQRALPNCSQPVFAASRVVRRYAAPFPGISDDTEFTNEAAFKKSAGQIPILRLLTEEGDVVPGAQLPFTLDEALGMYKTMVKVAVVDQVLNALQRQGRVSFYMTNTGEEAAQVGSAAALQADDVMWPQYRELGAFFHRGFTIQQVTDQCMGRKDEPGKGRQMPVHYCDANLQIQAVTSPLATQIPQAVGAGYSFRVGGEQRCAVAYFGDGSASEGDFAVALNFAATLKAQTLFICRNNGWAISTGVKEQYAGDGIAVRGVAYGLRSIRADGNDLAASFAATQLARKHCIETGEPVIIELMTYRRGHHSTSDDATRYRRGPEVKSMARPGLEPLSRARLLLEGAGLWDRAKDDALRDALKDEVMTSLRLAEEKKFASVDDMFEDVWAELPPNLVRQRAELHEHLARHPDKYSSLSRYESR